MKRIGSATSRTATAAGLALALGLLAACSGGGSGEGDGEEGGGSGGKDVTLVTHDSFLASDEVLAQFTEETGYEVHVVRGGDAGVMVNQAILSQGHPQGDVLFGVDNTLLSRALDADLFEPYEAAGLDAIPAEVQLDAEQHRVTPVDTGDICVNYDRAYFADHHLDPPASLDDLTDPAYADLLVVENAATSSPGLGFLLATVSAFGEDGWQDYWQRLADNGVEVVDSWETAYDERFSGAGHGDRPLVVSYASSPPAGVYYAGDDLPDQAPTGVSAGTCFRQVEFAGLLTGAGNPEGGRALIDFLLSRAFQEDMPLQMFVDPVLPEAQLPEVYTRYGETIEDPYRLDPGDIAEHREEWIDDWTSLVVR
ncbi:thiamine ABC transporter substrate-binding protein [Streptomyces hoynatensis]|uniref:Thiamine ABC transporter substrate-binding protein n=1 Tax=Streptomyces hoynatensis TaxID=1141874 RepID=A0A3A9YS04_9ACTN|nr:thiamine ABC transporter substrate-binding protein [Streptomyces hoynatensis]RKN38770.1 thiamine ABC transporter substrate-binding protein [Streptomyces hoynatensis]